MLNQPQQLALTLRPVREGADTMPFAVEWHKVRRAVRRELPKLDVPAQDLIVAARLVETQVLLQEVRKKARRAARAGGRMSKRALFAYVCQPAGRRAARVIARLSERIAAQEAQLCG